MHYVVVAIADAVPSPDVLEIFQDESEADGMFLSICSEYDLEEFAAHLNDQRNGLMRYAVDDGGYYSVSMYSRKIIV